AAGDAAPAGCPGASCRRPHSGRAAADAGNLDREVGRGHVAGNLEDAIDRVLAEVAGVLADDLLGRRLVDAVRHHGSVLVDDYVAVLPDDRRVTLLDDLA